MTPPPGRSSSRAARIVARGRRIGGPLGRDSFQAKSLQIDAKGTQMIRKGDVIENPVTGERLLFLETSRETGGEYVLVECTVQPNGFVAAAHMHPYQTERFEIESGTVAFKLDGEEIVAGPGETRGRPGRAARTSSGTPARPRRSSSDRGAPRAPVRAAARDDVRARERRQDEPEGHAEPAPPRGDRERALRRRAPSVPAGLDAEGRASRWARRSAALLGFKPEYDGARGRGAHRQRSRI